MVAGLRTGTFESTLDDKGRVVIPSSLREQYQGHLVIFYGWHSCVWVMKSGEHEDFKLKMRERLKKEKINNDVFEAFQSLLDTEATDIEIDPKTGRIPIPASIRGQIELTKDCRILNVKKPLLHLEIWNSQAHRDYLTEMQLKAKETMSKIGLLDFTEVGA